MSRSRLSATNAVEASMPSPAAGTWPNPHLARRRVLVKLATIVLPLAFLAATNLISHFAIPSLHSAVGLGLVFLIAAPGVVVFSTWVFGQVEGAERREFRRSRELFLLNTVAAASSEPLSPKDLLQMTVDGVVAATNADAAFGCFVDRQAATVRHVASCRMPDPLMRQLTGWVQDRVNPGRGDASSVDVSEPVDVTPSLSKLSGSVRAEFPCLLWIPFRADQQIRGGLILASHTPLVPSPLEDQFLRTLGGQVAVAEQRAVLQQQMADIAILQERERIAREMHDGLSQVLGYINAKTSAISRLLADGNVESAREEIGGLREAAREVYGDVRESILGLRVASAGPGALMERLGEYAKQFSGMNSISLTLNLLGPETPLGLSAAAEIQAMRIVQEALTNVRKHAGAKAVTLMARKEEGWLHISVEDDGRGFDSTSVLGDAEQRFGLKTMQERATAVGGFVEVDSTPGTGCRVEIGLPLQGAAA